MVCLKYTKINAILICQVQWESLWILKSSARWEHIEDQYVTASEGNITTSANITALPPPFSLSLAHTHTHTHT